MISKLHQRLGTAGFIISIIALVAALGGGAYAASGGLTGKQKKEVQKIAQTEAKKFAKAGPQGQPGAKGDAGAPGAAGAKGDAGAAGANGQPGAAGNAGVSVTTTTAGPECSEGGTKFTSASGTSFVCNGEEGPQGQTGFTETLPSGKTETGSWGSLSEEFGGGAFSITNLSFNIPLSAPLDAAHVKFIELGGTVPTGCTGGSVSEPKADAGFLCVYTGTGEFPAPGSILKPSSGQGGADKAGAVLLLEAPNELFASGSWAVTAP
jgi:Collagen triple helix repeat (20 copies)